MSKRLFIDQKEVKEIYVELKEKGMSGYQIGKIIGDNFRMALYRGQSLSEKSVKRLELLANKKLTRRVKPVFMPMELIKNRNLAEMVGVLLGDGGIYIAKKSSGGNQFKITISLNGVDDADYVDYIRDLFEKVFKKAPTLAKTRGKAIQLVTYSKPLAYGLMSIGLKSGNKTKNQVSVPNWIKSDKIFTISCLRGLIDTDGSIYYVKRNDTIWVCFSNCSIPLLNDFKSMCNTIGITTNSTKFKVYIYSKKQVQKFLDIVSPFKWKMLISRNPLFEQKLKYK